MKPFPFYKQLDSSDCGPTCIRIIAAHHQRFVSAQLLRDAAKITKEGVSLYDLSEAAESIGFKALPVKIDFDSLLHHVNFPCIVHWKANHFVVVYKVKGNYVYVSDPAHGLLKHTKSEFKAAWLKYLGESVSEGHALILEPTPKFFESEFDSGKKLGFGFLRAYLKPYRKYVIQLFIGLAFGSLLQLIFPFLTQSVVDYGINYQNLHFVTIILLAQIVLFVSQLSVEIIRSWILLHITSRINISLVSNFLSKLMRLSISFFDSKNMGDIIQRVYDHNRVQSFLSTTTLNTLFSVINVIIFGIVLAYYSLTVFAIFFSGSVVYIIWTILFLKKRAELDYKRFDQASENQNSLFQLISGMQEIKLNGSEQRRRWEWEAIQVRLFRISTRSLTLSQTQRIGGSFLFQLQNILITYFTVKSVIAGELTLGMMLSVQYIIGQLTAPINSFVGFVQLAQDAKISLERLSEIHNMPEEDSKRLGETTLPEDKTIRIQNLSFRYGGQASPLILDSLDFDIPQNKVTAIVGASGSGKTTLLKLLLKFYEPSKGDIFIDNINLKDINAKTWRKVCGSVMQDGFIFSDTIARNITESDSNVVENPKKLGKAAYMANIGDIINALPGGYYAKIGSRGTSISGGQKQRILIARAVYKDPHYIFFDEATSALDSENERTIMKNFEEFQRGKTVLIVAHRLSTVKNADQIVVLQNGRAVEKGNHKELIGKAGIYYKLVKDQLELRD